MNQNEPYMAILWVRFKTSDKKELERLAARQNLTLAEYTRRLIHNHIINNLSIDSCAKK